MPGPEAPIHLLTLGADAWPSERVRALLDAAAALKADPSSVRQALAGRTLLMLFEKPSLRTRVSFEVGMTELGGHAIFYAIGDSPLGKKETHADTARVLSRYVAAVMARVYAHSDLEELARHSSVPIINALSNFSHPCQALADLLTVREQKGRLDGVRLCYLGDANNNVTHSLMYAGARVGMHVVVGCPDDTDFRPQPAVLERATALAAQTGGSIEVVPDAAAAVAGADVVYADSWMSYHIQGDERDARTAILTPYQVTSQRMAEAAEDAIFMNCLPAMRGEEQTAEVIDGPQSVVFDQAENRLHAQKALLIELVALADQQRG